ncbi:MAG TPA: hypothetical protein VGZ22_24930 [Isosphaeraceae bacterium]|jgi:hypothetical protein|nr:hypothetical protein [Isosphaeraceae bacterium]
MASELFVRGAIVDSWVEPSGSAADVTRRVVLQVAPQGRPHDLMMVEAAASLVNDQGWLEDLGENLCHGSPISAFGWLGLRGEILATQIELAR